VTAGERAPLCRISSAPAARLWRRNADNITASRFRREIYRRRSTATATVRLTTLDRPDGRPSPDDTEQMHC